jgi:muconolactone delta-isomerase
LTLWPADPVGLPGVSNLGSRRSTPEEPGLLLLNLRLIDDPTPDGPVHRHLERVSVLMPLPIWRTDEVMPLSAHPNDPSPSLSSLFPQSPFRCSPINMPGRTPSEAVDDVTAREAQQASNSPFRDTSVACGPCRLSRVSPAHFCLCTPREPSRWMRSSGPYKSAPWGTIECTGSARTRAIRPYREADMDGPVSPTRAQPAAG